LNRIGLDLSDTDRADTLSNRYRVGKELSTDYAETVFNTERLSLLDSHTHFGSKVTHCTLLELELTHSNIKELSVKATSLTTSLNLVDYARGVAIHTLKNREIGTNTSDTLRGVD
jgi:hypothetical protein